MNNGHRNPRKDFVPCVGQHCIEENLCRIQDMYGYEAEETKYIISPLVMKYEATASCSESFPDKAVLLVDHEEYECEKQTLGGGLIAYGDSDYKTCPAIVTIDEKKCTATIAVKKALGSVKVALYYTENVVHPMNEKFLPNGSGGGGLPSDLVETVPDIVDLAFDGTLDGKEYKTVSMEGITAYYVKMSNDVPAMDDLVSFHSFNMETGEELNKEVEDGDLSSSGSFTGYYVSSGIAIVREFSIDSETGVQLDPGVWFMLMDASIMGGTGWMGGLGLTYNGGERTQIKPEFLPKHLQFREKVTKEPLNITFDLSQFESEQDIINAGYETVVNPNDDLLVKISDAVLTMEQIIGTAVTLTTFKGEVNSCTLTSDMMMDFASQGIELISNENMTFTFVYGDTSASGMNLSAGIWFGLTEDFSAINLSNPNVTITTSETTPLPEKFMPDLNQLTMISPSGKKFKVTVDDSGKLTAVEV